MTLYEYFMSHETTMDHEIFDDTYIQQLADSLDADYFSKVFCKKSLKEAGVKRTMNAFKKYCPNYGKPEMIHIEGINEGPVENKIYLPDGGSKKLNLTYNPTTYELEDPLED